MTCPRPTRNRAPRTVVALGEKWWRGLDSNQRTLARADLQSAAFNHSATSPGVRQARHVAARVSPVNALNAPIRIS